jgi:MFS family permease
MTEQAQRVQRIYLVLTLLSTLAASLIWGVNTLFLLDAGLSNAEAFAANAFFTAGEVMFEVPTGVVADIWGRRTSYLLGAATLLVSTLLYLLMWHLRAPLWGWAIASIVIGLGFTFFSGATEAWLVDALRFSGYDGELDPVFAKGQAVSGVAMLVGSVAGGFVAQYSNLGMPYVVRSVLLGLTLIAAFVWMKDLGFTPDRTKRPMAEVRNTLRASIDNGLRNRPVRWLMLSGPFTLGVAIYAFYALQPYLLELYGNKRAFGVAGLAAAILAGTQIIGGLSVPLVRRLFTRRTSMLLLSTVLSIASLAVIGWTSSFWIAVGTVVVWGLTFSAAAPMRQAYLNGAIPSAQRATVLSFDNMMASAGGVVSQPILGRTSDLWGYPASYFVSAAIQVVALPFLVLARRERAPSDSVHADHATEAS